MDKSIKLLGMAEMTKRERVQRALRFQEVDRVPVYDLLRNDAAIEFYSGEKLTIEDGLRITCKAIGRSLDMTRSICGPSAPGVETNGQGFTHRRERWTSWIEKRPFGDLRQLKEFIKNDISRGNQWKPESDFRQRFREHFLHLQSLVGDTVILHSESGVGLDHAYHTAKMENFAYLMADDPGLVSEWLEVLTRNEVDKIRVIGDPTLSPVALTYGDIACKGTTLFSPAFLRREFFPRLRRINDAWHEFGIFCLFHSDGYLMPVMDDIIESGCDGLNPIEIQAGMSVREVRDKYPKLFIAGGMDVSQLMANGDPQQVEAACREAIEATGGRGYFLGSTTELHNAVQLENYIRMVESAQKYSPGNPQKGE